MMPLHVSTLDFGGHRLSARSVSWSNTGGTLAVGSSDRTTRLCNVDGSSVREFGSLSGHNGAVQRVRFHPSQESTLCTTASDSSVRIWDVRSSSHKAVGFIDVEMGTSATDMSWSTSASDPSLLAVTERNGNITVYDTRKVPTAGNKGGGNSAMLKVFHASACVVEGCIFSPGGRHLVGAMTQSGAGEMKVWEWDTEDASGKFVYPAHTGPIYSMAFSPNGEHLATGGADAIVGLWEVDSMVCTNTIDRSQKFIRSVVYSHDSKYVASSSSDDGIDLALSQTGALVGRVSLGQARGWADEISFHPKQLLLACARCPSIGPPPPAVTVARISLPNQ